MLLLALLVMPSVFAHMHQSQNSQIVSAEEDIDDDITILNRLNFLHVDIEDYVYFDLRRHFFYKVTKEPHWHLYETYNDTIKISVKKTLSATTPVGGEPVYEYKSYLEINMKDLYNVLYEEYQKSHSGYDPKKKQDFTGQFRSSITLSYSKFEKDDEGKVIAQSYSLSQNLDGMITNITIGEYSIPKALRYLNYRKGSSPLLPYSYRNILNGDLTVKHRQSIRKCIGFGEFQKRKNNDEWHGDKVENICEQVGRFVPEQQETEDEQKYDLEFKKVRDEDLGVVVKSTTFGEFYQWSNLMQDPPLHWKLHRNTYMMYVQDSIDYPIAKVYKITKPNSSMVLIKTVKLAQECKQRRGGIYTTRIASFDLNENSMILRCDTDDPEIATYFYRFVIVDKIVLIEKQKFNPSLKHCSDIYYGGGMKDYIPKMACIKHQEVDGKVTDQQMGVVLFEVYDEPLEFREISNISVLDLMPDQYATGKLGHNSKQIQELMEKTNEPNSPFTYVFKFTVDQIKFSVKNNDHFLANMMIKLVVKNIRPLIIGETDYRGTYNYVNYIAQNPFLQDKGAKATRILEEHISFSDSLFICPTREAILVADKNSRTVIGYQGLKTKFSYNTKFMQWAQLTHDGIFCLPDEGKMAIIYTQKDPSTTQTMLRVAVYSTSFPTKASTRLLYIETFRDYDENTKIIPNFNPEDQSLSFFYTTHKPEATRLLEQSLKSRSTSAHGIKNLVARTTRRLKYSSIKLTIRQRIMEMRKPIDSPRIRMDFKNTIPGIYMVELDIFNSYKNRKTMKLHFNIHCTEDPRSDIAAEIQSLPFKIHSNIIGNPLAPSTKETQTINQFNEYSISQNIHILGNLVDMRLASADQDLLNQLKLIPPISYEYYFGAKTIGTNYDATYVQNGTLYGVTRRTIDEYKFSTSNSEMDRTPTPDLELNNKLLQKNNQAGSEEFDGQYSQKENFEMAKMELGDFQAFAAEPKFIQVYDLMPADKSFYMDDITDDQANSLLRKVVFTVNTDSQTNKLSLSVLESITIAENTYGSAILEKPRRETMDRVNKKSYNLIIEGSELYTSVGKITVMKKSDNFFILVIAHSDNKFLDFFKIEMLTEAQTQGDVHYVDHCWDLDQTRLQRLSQELLGISKFAFNDYYANIIANVVEIILLQDTKMYFVRLCSVVGSIMEFFDVKNLEYLSRMTAVECFAQPNEGNSGTISYSNTECIVATQGSYAYKFMVHRDIVWKERVTDKGEKYMAKYYKFKNIEMTKAFSYPCTHQASKIILGDEHFMIFSDESIYLLVFERRTNNPFTIGGVWIPYQNKCQIHFTSIGDQQHIIMTSRRESGRVYKLGDFKIKFRNPITKHTLMSHCAKINALKQKISKDDEDVHEELLESCYNDELKVWLQINNKISHFGFEKKEFKLKILPGPNANGADINGDDESWMNRGLLVGLLAGCILLTICACIAVKKEKKKKNQLKGDMRNVNKVLRAQVMDLKFRKDNDFFSLTQQDYMEGETEENGGLKSDQNMMMMEEEEKMHSQ